MIICSLAYLVSDTNIFKLFNIFFFCLSTSFLFSRSLPLTPSAALIKPNQIKLNRSDQIKSINTNQTKTNQFKPNQTKPNTIKLNQINQIQLSNSIKFNYPIQSNSIIQFNQIQLSNSIKFNYPSQSNPYSNLYFGSKTYI